MACSGSQSLASKLRARMLKDINRKVSTPGSLQGLINNKNDEEKTPLTLQESKEETLILGESATKQTIILQDRHGEKDSGSDTKSCQQGLRRKMNLTSAVSQENPESSGPENPDDLLNKKRKKETLPVSDDTRPPEYAEQELSLARRLSEEAGSDDPPTAARLKLLGVKCLTQLLRYNDRPVYQGMDLNQLARMVLDYMKNGCPPPCPKCAKGKLRFSNGKKKYGKRYYWCPGFTNNGKKFYSCNFKADRQHITRVPWKCP